MSKYILIPDSFKGSLSSEEICGILGREIRALEPEAEICSIPVADGGEGTVDAFLAALGGEKIPVSCRDPYGRAITACYGLLPDGGTAVIEMAAAAGLPLVGDDRRVADATTYGVGQLMAHALKRGAKRIVLGLGGSATNDGGCGAASACGVRFVNGAGESFVPVGGTLGEIALVDVTGLDPAVAALEIVTMCDIDNPLCGPTGAAAVFGPQKGADAAQIQRLDAGLAHLAQILERDLGISTQDLPGAGAAGGMGAGMAAFFGSRLQPGIETVLDTVRFEEVIRDADWILTGEGRLDGQSLRGKVVSGVARRAGGVPVAAIVGDVGDGASAVYDRGVSAVFSINRVAVPYLEARPRARRDLEDTVADVVRVMKISWSAGKED